MEYETDTEVVGDLAWSRDYLRMMRDPREKVYERALDWFNERQDLAKQLADVEATLKLITNVPREQTLLMNAEARAMYEYANRALIYLANGREHGKKTI